MQKRWFVHDGEDVDFFDSELAAREAAQSALDRCYERAAKGGEWPEEIEHIMWGRIEQGVVSRGDDFVLIDLNG
jgi:hypothetical protein